MYKIVKGGSPKYPNYFILNNEWYLLEGQKFYSSFESLMKWLLGDRRGSYSLASSDFNYKYAGIEVIFETPSLNPDYIKEHFAHYCIVI